MRILKQLTLTDIKHALRLAGVVGLAIGMAALGYWFASRLTLDEARLTIAVLVATIALIMLAAAIAVPRIVTILRQQFAAGTEHAMSAATTIAAIRQRAQPSHKQPANALSTSAPGPNVFARDRKMPSFSIAGEE